MKIITLHPTGNRNVRAIVTALSEAGMLAEFNTALSISKESAWLKLLPEAMRNDLIRRSFPLQSGQVHTTPWLEMARILLPKIGLKKLVRHEHGWASVDAVYHQIDKAASRRISLFKNNNTFNAIYAYEDGALASFTRAKELGICCIYDLPIAYWETGRTLMMEEAKRLPAWANTMGGGTKDSAEKLKRKTRELELADIIVCPGKFVGDSLPLWAKNKKLIMAPFGSPQVSHVIDNDTPQKKREGPLRILFVGSMGQRKGLADLFAAMKLVNAKDFELVVMGSQQAPIEFYRSEYPDFIYEPGRPNAEVLRLMRSCDVFCLPSIVEGRALVMQEAMSQGLPLIITPNTGGEDLILEGETGFLVPIRSPEMIAEKLNWFNLNRSEISRMGQKAQQHAANYTWEEYGAKVIKGITDFCV